MIDTYRDVVRAADANKPRSRQRRLGPSEAGVACPRRIAYRLIGTEPVNTDTDPWAAIVGSAVHAWLDRAFAADADRYLTEVAVELPGYFRGTADLLDRQTATVIDHKVVGAMALKRYRSGDISEQYRTQVHLYACGLRLAGHQVDNVGIVFWSRSGGLRDAFMWTEPYDEARVESTLRRIDALRTLTEGGRGALPLIPTADAFCAYCPFYLPGVTDVEDACPGHVEAGSTTQPNLTGATP